MEMLNIMTNTLGAAAGITILITILTRFLPNDKLYMWGYDFGLMLSTFASKKIGYAWNKFEDFICNSIGVLFNGFRDGLNADDSEGKISPPSTPEKENNKDSVRK